MTADAGLSDPSGSLTGFPTVSFGAGRVFYRAVTRGRAPWWFGSDGSQRFDLSHPRGTCYVATDVATAIREKGRSQLLNKRCVTPEFVASFDVYELHLPVSDDYADTGHPGAVAAGANRELATLRDYSLTRTWARVFARDGFRGISYPSRFSSALECNALAVFGEAGDAGLPTARKRSGAEAFAAAGLAHMLAPTPLARHAVIVEPPH